MGDAIRVLLVDDHTLVRQGLAALVGAQPDIQVVGECGDGTAVLALAEQCRPDVVVLDIALPGMNGLDVCRKLLRQHPRLGVLMLSMYVDSEYVTRALRCGARGYVLKEAAAEQLIQAVRTVAAGQRYLDMGIRQAIEPQAGDASDDPSIRLTPRERQVLQLIAEGASNRIVAERLGLSIKTVDTHRSRLMKKLGIHDQTRLVKYAIRKGLAPLD
jgi:DNA-binding NarL/FixJ family response regulator